MANIIIGIIAIAVGLLVGTKIINDGLRDLTPDYGEDVFLLGVALSAGTILAVSAILTALWAWSGGI